MIVGEAPGEHEEKQGTPFVGASGYLLDRMLQEAGIKRYECALTNVFDERPPGNSLSHWADAKVAATRGVDQGLPFALIQAGKASFLIPSRVQPALQRLAGEIRRIQPKIIIALGATALTALTGLSGISKHRGVLVPSTLVPGVKVLPTFHPSFILQSNYSDYPTVIMDLMKAAKEQHHAEIIRVERKIYVEPTVVDLCAWRETLLRVPQLTIDCETRPSIGHITCIGFAPNKTEAYVVPFWDDRKEGYSYWSTVEEEVAAWMVVKDILEGPASKTFQNGMYDIQYFLNWKWFIRRFNNDTMLKHAALFPRMTKSLGFLGSLYTNETHWKGLRHRAKEEKRDA